MSSHHPTLGISVGVLLAIGVLVFGYVWYMPTEEQKASVSFEKITTSRKLAEQWLIANVKQNGGFVYRYDPVANSSPESNNELRQLMATRLLGELAREDSSLYNLHRKNLAYVMDRFYVSSGDIARIEHSRKSKLGAIAMGVRALVASPFADEYMKETLQLAETMLQLQQPDGSFRAWWIAPTYEYDEDYLLTFYSGEAILAWVELYLRTQDTKRLDAARRAQDFYLIRYVDQIDAWYYPAYVPRHTMSLWHLWQITKDEHYAEAIFTLNDKLIDEMLDTSMYTGRFYNPAYAKYGTPHSSSDAVYTEGVAYAYALARQRDDQKHLEKYASALDLAVKNLITLQYTEDDVFPQIDATKILGSIRINSENPEIRVDTTQHMIDAFRAVERFVQ